ncbi:DUF4132 domain-containing protein [Actinomadura fibrosa]|uniref:DUF4132 domain-containing protein n=1 Tax=Actinomadura fibrosa TaxID=111802 RepID=A0ABW2XFB6_9ACTN|nr:DUF4132 domain-containing protein [Actinomadura fibrosa]
MTAIPDVLLSPPWAGIKKTKKQPEDLVPGLLPPADRVLAWKPGERDAWAATRASVAFDDAALDRVLRQYRAGASGDHRWLAALFAQGPEDAVRPFVASWRPESWDLADALRPVVARFGVLARDAALHAAEYERTRTGAILLPFLDADVVRLIAHWACRVPTMAALTSAYLERHGVAAVPFLVPDALARPTAPRTNAAHVLRIIAASEGPDAVVGAARVHGDEAAAAIGRLLAADLRKDVQAPPPLPVWADPSTLPPVPLRGGRDVLPPDAVRALVLLLAMTKAPDAYPAASGWLDEAVAACEPGAVAELAWALFTRWLDAGRPSTHNWALRVLARVGDDETARRLGPVVRACPGWSKFARAAAGLETLAAIGTTTALLQVAGVARSKDKPLRERAHAMIGELARERGLTAERLTDRLVPDFSLDADGSMVLDYGPRRFTVGFDEQLKPYVRDDKGKPRKALPKPGARDDAARAEAARARYDALRKDVRTVAADRVHRLETAMVTGERWTAAEFRAHFAEHPLLWHLARRVVWQTWDATGSPSAFRVAEDRTLADVHDAPLDFPDAADVGVAHPLRLGDDLKAWAELFADYEILQPFPQLARPVHTLTDEERAGTRLERFEGATVPFGAVLGLTRRGWDRGPIGDGGIGTTIVRRVGDDRYVVVELDPGIVAGQPNLSGEQRLTRVHASRVRDGHGPAGPPLGEVDAVLMSEILADLNALKER